MCKIPCTPRLEHFSRETFWRRSPRVQKDWRPLESFQIVPGRILNTPSTHVNTCFAEGYFRPARFPAPACHFTAGQQRGYTRISLLSICLFAYIRSIQRRGRPTLRPASSRQESSQVPLLGAYKRGRRLYIENKSFYIRLTAPMQFLGVWRIDRGSSSLFASLHLLLPGPALSHPCSGHTGSA